MPNEHGDGATRRAIRVALVVQVLVTLALVPLGRGDGIYLAGAAVLGAVMLGWSAFGPSSDRWARGLFAISVVYLPLLFGLLVVTS